MSDVPCRDAAGGMWYAPSLVGECPHASWPLVSLVLRSFVGCRGQFSSIPPLPAVPSDGTPRHTYINGRWAPDERGGGVTVRGATQRHQIRQTAQQNSKLPNPIYGAINAKMSRLSVVPASSVHCLPEGAESTGWCHHGPPAFGLPQLSRVRPARRRDGSLHCSTHADARPFWRA